MEQFKFSLLASIVYYEFFVVNHNNYCYLWVFVETIYSVFTLFLHQSRQILVWLINFFLRNVWYMMIVFYSQIIFLETLCNDRNIIERNIRLKVQQSPDYAEEYDARRFPCNLWKAYYHILSPILGIFQARFWSRVSWL